MGISASALGLAILASVGSPAAPAKAPGDAIRLTLDGYARLAAREYGEARRGAESMRGAIRTFLEHPSDTSLARARAAWIACRDAYGRTEVFRFSGGPIDDVHPITGKDGPEGRINGWPIDEAFLDRVAGSTTTGLIGDTRAPMTEQQLISRNQADDENQVTLGYHALEFLLWGQDLRADGPGARPFTDYLPGDPVRERRRRCLLLVTDLLIRDLKSVETEWTAGPKRYVEVFRTLDPKDALGRALSGPVTLAVFELASERIGLPLASRGQEDEQSCFSDNTHRDIAANVEGIAMVLEGENGCPGLLTALDPSVADDIRSRLERIRKLAYTIVPPFDAILLAPDDDPRRRTLQALAGELIELAGVLQRAGESAGAHVVIGGGG